MSLLKNIFKSLSILFGVPAMMIFFYTAITYTDLRKTTEYDQKYNMIAAYSISYIYSTSKKDEHEEEAI